MSRFVKELEQLINKYSIENESDTPDFILAEYIRGVLNAFNKTIGKREAWYGRKPQQSKTTEREKEWIPLNVQNAE